MAELRYNSRQEIQQALFVSVSLGIFLAGGFLPTAQTLAGHLGNLPYAQLLGFPALSALFFFSLPSRQTPARRFGSTALWATLLPAIAIAGLHGHLLHFPSLSEAMASDEGRRALLWNIASVAIGEELLFRGWFYNVVDRVWQRSIASRTNPLPLAVWMSALGFSIWHLQNLVTDPWPEVLFQSTYTFWTGLWLGYLRWKTGSLALPVVAHSAINAAGFVF